MSIFIAGIIWFVIAYCVLCLPMDLEIKKIRKERRKQKNDSLDTRFANCLANSKPFKRF